MERDIKFNVIPPSVGCYNINGGKDKTGSIQFIFSHKPSAWHRMWTRFFLGWVWIDN